MNAPYWHTLSGKPPRVIAHRGASGQCPEHSREAFALAFSQRADAVEPDVLPSRDGVLFVRHDVDLALTTDIAARAQFATRARHVDGKSQWWIGDFVAAELDTLHCIEPNPLRRRNAAGRSPILRLAQLLDMARAASCIVDIEIKDPAYFHALGHAPADLLEAELGARHLLGADAPVWLECFDLALLRTLHARCGNRCFALLEATPDENELRSLAVWTSGLAPSKTFLWDAVGNDSGLVAQVHAAGLEVHAWTFRDDGDWLPFASPQAELVAAMEHGVDALFCDFPASAVALRDSLARRGEGGVVR
ncbi:MAG: glycerophosphodiester phosphodiesterase family protein [Rudaea sp.]